MKINWNDVDVDVDVLHHFNPFACTFIHLISSLAKLNIHQVKRYILFYSFKKSNKKFWLTPKPFAINNWSFEIFILWNFILSFHFVIKNDDVNRVNHDHVLCIFLDDWTLILFEMQFHFEPVVRSTQQFKLVTMSFSIEWTGECICSKRSHHSLCPFNSMSIPLHACFIIPFPIY